VLIKVAQDWRPTRVIPRDFHVWEMFIRPAEMLSALQRCDLRHREMWGLELRANPLAMLRLIRKVKAGTSTYCELGRYISPRLKLGKRMYAAYIGYAIRESGAAQPW
jgi:2-polyprenyl-6-hydroxyphenyl methylase/3-demethylubiquinone-9 3-methyltransferase